MEILVVWIVISVAVGALASSRGRSAIGWGLGSLLLSPLIALILVLVLPSRRDALDQRSLRRGTHKKCPQCAEVVKVEAEKCRYCGHDFFASRALGVRNAALQGGSATYDGGDPETYRHTYQ